MNETAMTESLDERDLLGTSRGPGVYALALAIPSMPTVAREQWAAAHATDPPDDAVDRLSAATRPLYVGASNDVYARLCDHAAGTRTPAICEAFPAERVVDVWPHPNPFDGPEVNQALALARDDEHVVWCDGEIYG